MNRLKWLLSRWTKKIGNIGIAGAGLFVFSIASYIALVVPESRRITALADDIQRARTEHPKVVKGSDEEEHMQKFYAYLPQQKIAPDLLEKIYASAREESIQLKQGKYNYTIGKNGRIGEYQVNFPMKGSYVQIRRFIAKVLNEIPSAALEDISFKREAISETELNARISFTIYMGAR